MDINTRYAEARARRNSLIVDVRTPEEYAAGHLPGAVNWPLEKLPGLEWFGDETLYTYCHSGSRSARAAALLGEMGFEVENIGGIVDWLGEVERE